MSRELRKVPENWEHPKDYKGDCVPLNCGYRADLADFAKKIEELGLEEAIEYFGGAPLKDNYMPEWPEEEKTHFMMYETCSEGTPISPVFDNTDELAHWLADTKASAFGEMTATYEQWLATCKQGASIGAVYTSETGFISGVEANEGVKNLDSAPG